MQLTGIEYLRLTAARKGIAIFRAVKSASNYYQLSRQWLTPISIFYALEFLESAINCFKNNQNVYQIS